MMADGLNFRTWGRDEFGAIVAKWDGRVLPVGQRRIEAEVIAVPCRMHALWICTSSGKSRIWADTGPPFEVSPWPACPGCCPKVPQHSQNSCCNGYIGRTQPLVFEGMAARCYGGPSHARGKNI